MDILRDLTEHTRGNKYRIEELKRRDQIYERHTSNLVERLRQNHSSIPKRDYFRYNVLPDKIAPHRRTFERMIIRDFASLLENKKDVNHKEFLDYTLANDKIDVR